MVEWKMLSGKGTGDSVEALKTPSWEDTGDSVRNFEDAVRGTGMAWDWRSGGPWVQSKGVFTRVSRLGVQEYSARND